MGEAQNHEAVQKFEAAQTLLAAAEAIQENHVREAQAFLREIRTKS